MDVFSKAKRSAVMSRIRGTRNKSTELQLVKVLRSLGISGWRRGITLRFDGSTRRSFVRPDFTFRSKRLAVFVDGCFWHGCPYHFTKPRTNVAFWSDKIAANRKRDRTVNRLLASGGWRVFRIWEHSLTPDECRRSGTRIKRFLVSISTP